MHTSEECLAVWYLTPRLVLQMVDINFKHRFELGRLHSGDAEEYICIDQLLTWQQGIWQCGPHPQAPSTTLAVSHHPQAPHWQSATLGLDSLGFLGFCSFTRRRFYLRPLASLEATAAAIDSALCVSQVLNRAGGEQHRAFSRLHITLGGPSSGSSGLLAAFLLAARTSKGSHIGVHRRAARIAVHMQAGSTHCCSQLIQKPTRHPQARCQDHHQTLPRPTTHRQSLQCPILELSAQADTQFRGCGARYTV